jgi:hypothetical protein
LAGVGQESPSTGWGEGSLSCSVELAISVNSQKQLIRNTFPHFLLSKYSPDSSAPTREWRRSN